VHVRGTDSIFTLATTATDGWQAGFTLFQHQIAAAWPPGSDQSHAPGWCLQPLQAQALVVAAVVVVQTPARQSRAQHQANAAAVQNAAAKGASCSATSRQVQSLLIRKVVGLRHTGKHRH
jgi:hypothetical protein